jgi:hypothetical protein
VWWGLVHTGALSIALVVTPTAFVTPQARTADNGPVRHGALAALHLDQVVLRVPAPAIPGAVDASPQRPTFVEAWAWVADEIAEVTDKPRSGSLPSGIGAELLEVLRRLVDSYRRGDLPAALSLYDPESRKRMEQRSADPQFLAGWQVSARTARAFVPLLIWHDDEARRYHCLVRLVSESEAGLRSVSPLLMSFNPDGTLWSGPVGSQLLHAVTTYFQDSAKLPSGLVANHEFVKRRVEKQK